MRHPDAVRSPVAHTAGFFPLNSRELAPPAAESRYFVIVKFIGNVT